MSARDATGSGWRELALAVAMGAALAVGATWPLSLHLGDRVPQDAGDPVLQAWQVAWDGHALLEQPLHFFQANIFWPLHDTLAFSDALIGYTPAGLLGTGAHAAVVRYDLLFLAAWTLTFVGAYLLARELGSGRLGAAVGGAAFAYAPWRLGQAGHLHVLSVGGIPLALFLLLRGYRRSSVRHIIGGWLVAAWQVSLGFTLGLQLVYLLAVIALAVVVGWLRSRPRRWPGRPVMTATATGAALLAATSIVLALPYLRVLGAHPESHRSLREVTRFSPPPRSLLAAAPDDVVWGGATAAVRGGLPAQREQLLFPGLAVVALALVGLGARPYTRRVRAWLLVGTLVTLIFALGFSLVGQWSPYRLLWQFAPGWQGIRTPGRLFGLTSLGLALLAAGGAHRLTTAMGGRVARPAVTAALLTVVILEGLGPIPASPAPAPPAGLSSAPAPLLDLPSDARHDNTYEYWSTDGFPAIVNGFSGFAPRELVALRAAVEGFPDRRTVSLLSVLGVRTVVLHHDLARDTPWRSAWTKSIAGLGVTRQRVGAIELFILPRVGRQR